MVVVYDYFFILLVFGFFFWHEIASQRLTCLIKFQQYLVSLNTHAISYTKSGGGACEIDRELAPLECSFVVVVIVVFSLFFFLPLVSNENSI